jgi:hypothetical protein
MTGRPTWRPSGWAILIAVVAWVAIFAAARWLGWL